MRKLKLKLLTQQELVVIETDVTTFNEFKDLPEVKELGVDWEQNKLIDKSTKTEMGLDESILPAVDSIMFVTPTRTKAGAYSYKEAKAWIKEFKEKGGQVLFNYTQATTQQLNDFIDSARANIEVVNEEEVEDTVEEATEIVEEDIVVATLKLLNKVKKNLKKLSKVTHKDTKSLEEGLKEYKDQLADFITKDDLQLEAEAIALRYR